MPGNTVSPIALERGGITTSATPYLRVQERVGAVLELVLLDERARVLAEVGRQHARAALRQQALAEQHDDRDRADQERDADERELEVAEAAHAGVVGGLRDDHVHRRAREHEQRAGVRGERERQQQLRGRAAEPHRHHDDDRQQRGDGAVDADQRRQQRDEQHRQHDQPSAARRRRD